METQNKTKKTIDYSKGKIYKIVCNTTGLIYVGSTIQKLCERLRGHRSHYKLYLKGKSRFYTSFDIIKNNNYEIILIENCPCNSKEELLREERKYIEKIDCLNKIIPTRTHKEYHKEYYQNNKELLKNNAKRYYDNNTNNIKDKMKDYRELKKKTIQCEFCNSTITAHHLRRHQRSLKCKKFQLSI